MMRVTRLLMLAGVALVASAGSSLAAFTVTFSGFPPQTIVSNEPGVPGTFQANGGNNGMLEFTVDSQATQVNGIATLSTDLSITRITAGGQGGPFTLTVTQDGFALPPGMTTAFASFTTNSGGTPALTTTATGVSFTTSVGGTTVFTTNTGTTTSGTSTAANSGGVTVNQANPFSQTFNIGSLLVGGSLRLTGSTQINVLQPPPPATGVPVPATALAAVLGLPVLGVFGRLRRKTVGA